MKFKQLAPVALPSLAFGLALGALFWHPIVRAYFSDYWASLNKVGVVMQIVHARYVDDKNASYEKLSEDAVAAIVKRDRHSRYMASEAFEQFSMHSKHQYFGIGVGFTIHRINDEVVITRVFPDGGAEAADVRSGDRILSVDGQELAAFSKLTYGARIQKIKQLITGETGTRVLLRLEDEQGQTRDVKVLRGKVQLATVEDVRMIGEVGFLRIDQFTEFTGAEFASAIGFLERREMKFLIIDLRDNLGGLLSAAIDVLGHFFEEGKPVVYVKGREGEQVHRSEGKLIENRPVVVLINQYSASASEIVAGALLVTGKAKLVGQTSFGKATVQSVFDFEDSTGMKLTTARYYLPGRVHIGEEGLHPDFEISCDDETWVKLILQRGQPAGLSEKAFERRFGFTPVEDPQLQAALRVVKGEPVEQVKQNADDSDQP